MSLNDRLVKMRMQFLCKLKFEFFQLTNKMIKIFEKDKTIAPLIDWR